MRLYTIAALGALALSALVPTRSAAQVPTQLPGGLPGNMTPDQMALLLQQNPQLGALVRQRLQQSGLTPEQIRTQLAASGYPANLLDAYFGTPPGQQALQPGAQELAAIQVLGLGAVSVRAESLPVDTGLIQTRSDSTASHVFGIDVFRRSTTQFLPLLGGPVPPDYKLGPGDVLVLILTGDVRSEERRVGKECRSRWSPYH